MEKLKEERGTKLEFFWVYFFQFIGAVVCIGAIYQTVHSWFLPSQEDVPISFVKIMFAIVGFFIARGGKSVGIATNNIGVILTDFLRKITNTK